MGHNIWRARVRATHMAGFLGPIFYKQGSLLSRFSLNMGEFGRYRPRIVENGCISYCKNSNIIVASFRNKRRILAF